jgi:hypothetical protein
LSLAPAGESEAIDAEAPRRRLSQAGHASELFKFEAPTGIV